MSTTAGTTSQESSSMLLSAQVTVRICRHMISKKVASDLHTEASSMPAIPIGVITDIQLASLDTNASTEAANNVFPKDFVLYTGAQRISTFYASVAAYSQIAVCGFFARALGITSQKETVDTDVDAESDDITIDHADPLSGAAVDLYLRVLRWLAARDGTAGRVSVPLFALYPALFTATDAMHTPTQNESNIGAESVANASLGGHGRKASVDIGALHSSAANTSPRTTTSHNKNNINNHTPSRSSTFNVTDAITREQLRHAGIHTPLVSLATVGEACSVLLKPIVPQAHFLGILQDISDDNCFEAPLLRWGHAANPSSIAADAERSRGEEGQGEGGTTGRQSGLFVEAEALAYAIATRYHLAEYYSHKAMMQLYSNLATRVPALSLRSLAKGHHRVRDRLNIFECGILFGSLEEAIKSLTAERHHSASTCMIVALMRLLRLCMFYDPLRTGVVGAWPFLVCMANSGVISSWTSTVNNHLTSHSLSAITIFQYLLETIMQFSVDPVPPETVSLSAVFTGLQLIRPSKTMQEADISALLIRPEALSTTDINSWPSLVLHPSGPTVQQDERSPASQRGDKRCAPDIKKDLSILPLDYGRFIATGLQLCAENAAIVDVAGLVAMERIQLEKQQARTSATWVAYRSSEYAQTVGYLIRNFVHLLPVGVAVTEHSSAAELVLAADPAFPAQNDVGQHGSSTLAARLGYLHPLSLDGSHPVLRQVQYSTAMKLLWDRGVNTMASSYAWLVTKAVTQKAAGGAAPAATHGRRRASYSDLWTDTLLTEAETGNRVQPHQTHVIEGDLLLVGLKLTLARSGRDDVSRMAHADRAYLRELWEDRNTRMQLELVEIVESKTRAVAAAGLLHQRMQALKDMDRQINRTFRHNLSGQLATAEMERQLSLQLAQAKVATRRASQFARHFANALPVPEPVASMHEEVSAYSTQRQAAANAMSEVLFAAAEARHNSEPMSRRRATQSPVSQFRRGSLPEAPRALLAFLENRGPAVANYDYVVGSNIDCWGSAPRRPDFYAVDHARAFRSQVTGTWKERPESPNDLPTWHDVEDRKAIWRRAARFFDVCSPSERGMWARSRVRAASAGGVAGEVDRLVHREAAKHLRKAVEQYHPDHEVVFESSVNAPITKEEEVIRSRRQLRPHQAAAPSVPLQPRSAVPARYNLPHGSVPLVRTSRIDGSGQVSRDSRAPLYRSSIGQDLQFSLEASGDRAPPTKVEKVAQPSVVTEPSVQATQQNQYADMLIVNSGPLNDAYVQDTAPEPIPVQQVVPLFGSRTPATKSRALISMRDIRPLTADELRAMHVSHELFGEAQATLQQQLLQDFQESARRSRSQMRDRSSSPPTSTPTLSPGCHKHDRRQHGRLHDGKKPAAKATGQGSPADSSALNPTGDTVEVCFSGIDFPMTMPHGDQAAGFDDEPFVERVSKLPGQARRGSTSTFGLGVKVRRIPAIATGHSPHRAGVSPKRRHRFSDAGSHDEATEPSPNDKTIDIKPFDSPTASLPTPLAPRVDEPHKVVFKQRNMFPTGRRKSAEGALQATGPVSMKSPKASGANAGSSAADFTSLQQLGSTGDDQARDANGDEGLYDCATDNPDSVHARDAVHAFSFVSRDNVAHTGTQSNSLLPAQVPAAALPTAGGKASEATMANPVQTPSPKSRKTGNKRRADKSAPSLADATAIPAGASRTIKKVMEIISGRSTGRYGIGSPRVDARATSEKATGRAERDNDAETPTNSGSVVSADEFQQTSRRAQTARRLADTKSFHVNTRHEDTIIGGYEDGVEVDGINLHGAGEPSGQGEGSYLAGLPVEAEGGYSSVTGRSDDADGSSTVVQDDSNVNGEKPVADKSLRVTLPAAPSGVPRRRLSVTYTPPTGDSLSPIGFGEDSQESTGELYGDGEESAIFEGQQLPALDVAYLMGEDDETARARSKTTRRGSTSSANAGAAVDNIVMGMTSAKKHLEELLDAAEARRRNALAASQRNRYLVLSGPLHVVKFCCDEAERSSPTTVPATETNELKQMLSDMKRDTKRVGTAIQRISRVSNKMWWMREAEASDAGIGSNAFSLPLLFAPNMLADLLAEQHHLLRTFGVGEDPLLDDVDTGRRKAAQKSSVDVRSLLEQELFEDPNALVQVVKDYVLPWEEFFKVEYTKLRGSLAEASAPSATKEPFSALPQFSAGGATTAQQVTPREHDPGSAIGALSRLLKSQQPPPPTPKLRQQGDVLKLAGLELATAIPGTSRSSAQDITTSRSTARRRSLDPKFLMAIVRSLADSSDASRIRRERLLLQALLLAYPATISTVQPYEFLSGIACLKPVNGQAGLTSWRYFKLDVRNMKKVCRGQLPDDFSVVLNSAALQRDNACPWGYIPKYLNQSSDVPVLDSLVASQLRLEVFASVGRLPTRLDHDFCGAGSSLGKPGPKLALAPGGKLSWTTQNDDVYVGLRVCVKSLNDGGATISVPFSLKVDCSVPAPKSDEAALMEIAHPDDLEPLVIIPSQGKSTQLAMNNVDAFCKKFRRLYREFETEIAREHALHNEKMITSEVRPWQEYVQNTSRDIRHMPEEKKIGQADAAAVARVVERVSGTGTVRRVRVDADDEHKSDPDVITAFESYKARERGTRDRKSVAIGIVRWRIEYDQASDPLLDGPIGVRHDIDAGVGIADDASEESMDATDQSSSFEEEDDRTSPYGLGDFTHRSSSEATSRTSVTPTEFPASCMSEREIVDWLTHYAEGLHVRIVPPLDSRQTGHAEDGDGARRVEQPHDERDTGSWGSDGHKLLHHQAHQSTMSNQHTDDRGSPNTLDTESSIHMSSMDASTIGLQPSYRSLPDIPSDQSLTLPPQPVATTVTFTPGRRRLSPIAPSSYAGSAHSNVSPTKFSPYPSAHQRHLASLKGFEREMRETGKALKASLSRSKFEGDATHIALCAGGPRKLIKAGTPVDPEHPNTACSGDPHQSRAADAKERCKAKKRKGKARRRRGEGRGDLSGEESEEDSRVLVQSLVGLARAELAASQL